MNRPLLIPALLLFLPASMCAGPTPPVIDAGCITYGQKRGQMPRPLPEGKLGQWVAETDSAMTGTCRG